MNHPFCCLFLLAGIIIPLIPCFLVAQASSPPETTVKPRFEDFHPVSKPEPVKPKTTPPPVPKPTPPSSPVPPKKTVPVSSAPAIPSAPRHDPPKPRAAPTIEELPLPPASPAPKFMEVMAAQILLDRHLISPGCIDGVIGRQTRQAIAAFQLMQGLPVTGLMDEKTKNALGPLVDLSTEHIIAQEELDSLRPLPHTWREKSREPSLAYETILELIAEKYHASQNGIRKLNPHIDWDYVTAGTVVSVPKVNKTKLPKAAFIQISLSQKLIRVFASDNRLIAQFPCSIAQKEEKRPVGRLEVINYAPNPTYLFNPDLFKEDARKEGIKGKLVIPSGPNNPVGVAWIGLNRSGYGIHGTPRPEDIGLTESRGCFRLTNWNAQRLMGAITIGVPVYVEMDFLK